MARDSVRSERVGYLGGGLLRDLSRRALRLALGDFTVRIKRFGLDRRAEPLGYLAKSIFCPFSGFTPPFWLRIDRRKKKTISFTARRYPSQIITGKLFTR